MPYIDTEARRRVEDPNEPYRTAGELTYGIYRLALHGLPTLEEITGHLARYPEPERYGDYALILGCFDAARRELRRRHPDMVTRVTALEVWSMWYYERVVAPYEDGKLEENGDVL